VTTTRTTQPEQPAPRKHTKHTKQPKPKRVPKHPATLFGPWGAVAVTLAVAMGASIMLGTDRAGLPRVIAIAAGALVGVLTITALPSVPTRLAVTAVLALGGFVVARHARLAGADGLVVLVWVAGTVLTLVLADRADLLERPPLERADGRAPRRRLFTRSMVGALLAVLVAGAVLAPAIDASLHRDVRTGAPANSDADPQSSALLSPTDELDMRNRPRLSDRVVMEVEADRPAFWRGETFTEWDGTTWRRGPDDRATVLTPTRDGRQIVPTPLDDPAAATGPVNRQTFTIEAPYASILFAAPTPTDVLSDRQVGSYGDGTLIVQYPLGRGATYTVTSHEADATDTTLRASAATPVPDDILAQFAQPPTTTPRVRALAHEITRGLATPYDKVRAIEAWMGSHTRYSLNAPLPPSNSTDVVDWFVFDAHEGWCEQIASTLVVMLREVGVPARLATGFVPGETDVVSGRYTVRERDAHAWAEVFFPGVGWQGFDPTASVPLAGDAHRTPTLWQRIRDHALLIVIVLALVGVAVLVAPLLRERNATRRRTRREPTWSEGAWRELAAIGAERGRPARPGDTPRAYARAVASLAGQPDLMGVGELVDRAEFGGVPPDDGQRARAEAVLAAARE
jgi:transglutaminase-like putative cysteine protease